MKTLTTVLYTTQLINPTLPKSTWPISTWPTCFNNETDLTHRIVETSTLEVHCKSWSGQEFFYSMYERQIELLHDVDALKKVTKWQKKHIEYQSVYNAFVLGAMTEEEFEEESEPYIANSENVPAEVLAPLITRLNRLLDFKLSDTEFSEYLEVELQSVEDAMRYIEYFGNDADGLLQPTSKSFISLDLD